jgi:hypothetical protein
VIPQLPPRASADMYVDKYFSDVNDILCVLSYNEFLPWYHQCYPDKVLDPAKKVILFMVLAFGTKDDANGAGYPYFSYALNAIGPVMEKGGLEAIQALTLMVHRNLS